MTSIQRAARFSCAAHRTIERKKKRGAWRQCSRRVETSPLCCSLSSTTRTRRKEKRGSCVYTRRRTKNPRDRGIIPSAAGAPPRKSSLTDTQQKLILSNGRRERFRVFLSPPREFICCPRLGAGILKKCLPGRLCACL